MKKHLLLLFFAIAASVVPAQNGDMYSLLFHGMGEYGFGIESVVQQRDGDIIAVTHISQYPEFLGSIFYKMSPSSLSITDTLFVADTHPPYYFYARDPHGEGNIRANLEYVEEVDSTFIRICHFPDNDLHINHNEDVMVPLREGIAYDQYDGYMVDCRGDVIMKYYTTRPDGDYDSHLARIDPDGTLKHQALFTENDDHVIPKLRVFKESPLQYYQWDYVESYNGTACNLAMYVIDSLFNKNTITINSILREESLSNEVYLVVYDHFEFSEDTEVIPVGGNDILVAGQYMVDTNFYPITAEYGVAVAKYDSRTMQLKDYIVFNDYLGYTKRGSCMGLKKMSDGTVYFLYKENGYPAESIIIVKMDTDLNVEWKRFLKTDNIIMSAPLQFPFLFEDEQEEEKGVAWVGGGFENDRRGLIYFFLNHDGTVGVNEGGIEVRPYCFYPNPTQDMLRMQFSPDVQPKQIELFDLQGRLVRTQRSNFERIDMSQLPTGTYTMRVTLEDGKTYADKVVKE